MDEEDDIYAMSGDVTLPVQSLLILGAPGVGKTTLIRDIVFQLARTLK